MYESKRLYTEFLNEIPQGKILWSTKPCCARVSVRVLKRIFANASLMCLQATLSSSFPNGWKIMKGRKDQAYEYEWHSRAWEEYVKPPGWSGYMDQEVSWIVWNLQFGATWLSTFTAKVSVWERSLATVWTRKVKMAVRDGQTNLHSSIEHLQNMRTYDLDWLDNQQHHWPETSLRWNHSWRQRT